MRHARSRPLATFGVLACIAIGAAACSSSPGSTTPTTSAAAASSTGATTSGTSGATVKLVTSTQFGKVLVDAAGKALYTYGPDKGHGGQATCTGGCLAAWPALTVTAGTKPSGGAGVTGTLAAVKQSDGKYQVTYNGMPLYTFVSDSSAGQVTGNGEMSFSVATVSSGSTTAGSSGAGSGSGSGSGSGGYGY